MIFLKILIAALVFAAFFSGMILLAVALEIIEVTADDIIDGDTNQ
ncbi:hypothetical protein ACFLZW_06480 [Chloroflexota bacterium]